MAKIFTAKDPDEVFLYRWQVELDTGDALSSISVSRIEGTATIGTQTADAEGLNFLVSGGADGETTLVRGLATTSFGSTIEETLAIPIVSSAGAAGFLAAFPAFAAVPSATIAFWAKRAARVVGDGWPTDDVDYAGHLLTAHLLTQQGLGTGAEAEAAAAGASGFKRIKSGALEIEQFDRGASGDLDTSYGRQFKALLRTARGGPRVTGTGTIPACGYPTW